MAWRATNPTPYKREYGDYILLRVRDYRDVKLSSALQEIEEVIKVVKNKLRKIRGENSSVRAVIKFDKYVRDHFEGSYMNYHRSEPQPKEPSIELT